MSNLKPVDVFDEFVQVFVPRSCLLVVEVHAHGHGHVGLGPVGRGPLRHHLQEGAGLLVNVQTLENICEKKGFNGVCSTADITTCKPYVQLF